MNLSQAERNNISILLVDGNNLFRTIARDILIQMGISRVSSTSSHQTAVTKISDQPITHVIFTTDKTDMEPLAFVKQVMEIDSKLVLIACAGNPTTDGVFELLQSGARGFLVKPIQADALEETIAVVSKTKQIPDFILDATDRNQALSVLILNSLDSLATVLRQARQFETAKHSIPGALKKFRQAVEVSKQFCEGGEDQLQEAIMSRLETAASEPATRLGKLRKRRKTRRKPKEE